MKRSSPRRVLVVGAAGGVGHAVGAALAHTDPGVRLAQSAEEILLLDAVEPWARPRVPHARWLAPRQIRSAAELAGLAEENRVDLVVDLSSLGTLDCVEACDQAGISFLTTSVEHWPEDPPPRWQDLVLAVLPGARPNLERASHLVGSGMNPGIVNALALRAIDALARIAGRPATAEALGVRAILVTEEDTTVEIDALEGDHVFPMTWSPRHCLEELFQPRSIVVREGAIEALDHAPHEALYRARCGREVIDGKVVPHEEVVTLAQRFPSVELAFVYRLAPPARRALAANPSRRDVADWRGRKLYPPHAAELRGRDRVGVLLCTEELGELWLGYDVDVADALLLGTTATQLQVAAGVVAGWTTIGQVRGIHFVEDLGWREYLATVDAVLGPPVLVHDAKAPLTLLDERRRRKAPTSHRGDGSRPAVAEERRSA